MFSFRHILISICALTGVIGMTNAQNLVENYSFETLSMCPDGFGGIGPTIAPPWEAPTVGTPDIFNECSTSWITDVPINFFGEQTPITGAGYSGFYCRVDNSEYREYLQSPFTEPMEAGKYYYVEFYVSLADNYCALQNIGAYLSVDPPGGFFTTYINVTPQIESDFGYMNDIDNWILISGCYQAQGGENYITIGNFHPDSETPLDPECGGGVSYYFCEDVQVLKNGIEGNFSVDLGDPVTECFSHEIDPQISGYTFNWSDGSSEPTLTVTETGVYHLTISEECYYATDSVEITILGNAPPVDLGPDEVTLCDGDVYTIDLDPDLSEYTWQDGSNSPSYEITTAGVYSVTLDDGCTSSQDQITVHVDSPPTFSFDEDAFLCPGEEILLDFNPNLGDFEWQDGNTNSTYVIYSGGNYTLTITNGCGSVTDEFIVTEIDLPVVDLGPADQEICYNGFIDLMVDPSFGSIVWQDNSTDPIYTVTGGGLYSVTITNQCGEASDEVFFEEVDIPWVYLGDDQQTICSGEEIEISLDPDEASYIWQDGSTEWYYTINTSGIYSVTATNACGTDSTQIEVMVMDSPVVTLGPDTTLCPQESLVLSAGNAGSNFMWQDGSSNEEFVVTASGVYAVTVTSLCGNAFDNITVNYLAPLTPPNLGPDISICPGEQAVLFPATTNADFIWSDLSTEDSLVVTTAGTYHILAYNTCEAYSDTIVVSVNNAPPAVDLPASVSLCQGDSIILDAAISGVSYLWQDGSVNKQLVAHTPGVYSVTVSNACGMDTDSVTISDAGLPPAVDLGPDVSICPGEFILLAPDHMDVNTWLWHDGTVLSTFDISSPGEISVEVANVCGEAHDTMNVTLLPAIPVLDLGPDTLLCPGESVVLSILAQDVDILWQDGSTSSTITTSDEGLYFASITNTCGVSYDTMEVAFLPDIPPLDLGPDQSLCPGETVTIDPGINGVDYLWQDGSTLATYSTTQQETIILTITNACGTISDTLEVIENNQGPMVDLGPDILACEGEVITVSAGVSGVNYLWQDGSTASSFSTSVSGEFILQVSNACGTDTDTIMVDIHGVTPVVDLGSDTTLCEGEILVLTSSAILENTILWQDGTGGDMYSVSTAGTYSLFESNHCGEDTDTITVLFTQAPEPFDLGADTLLCPGESITLSAPNTSDQILWQDGSDQFTMIADQPQAYWLQISNACGIASDSMFISFDHNTPVLNLATSISFCEGDIITLDATQPFAANYQWSNGATSSSIDVTTPDVYNIIVSTLCQSASQDIDIYPGDDCIIPDPKDGVYIPNVFSPNQDGINDVFTVFFGTDLNVVSMQGSIYDRWGNLVYVSEENPFAWDGMYGGQDVLPGVYIYVISIKTDVQGISQEHHYAGDVTLIR